MLDVPFLRVRQPDHGNGRHVRAGCDHRFDILELQGAVLHFEPGVVVVFGGFAIAAREALRNAITRGQPKRVRILLTYEPEQIRMEVTDDGVGFEAGEVRVAPDITVSWECASVWNRWEARGA
jgi:hypothetical protein